MLRVATVVERRPRPTFHRARFGARLHRGGGGLHHRTASRSILLPMVYVLLG
jgi:hypothetical protein